MVIVDMSHIQYPLTHDKIHSWDVIVKSTLKMILEIACAPEVLCMLWNEDLAWHQAEFQFVEIFSGRANVSREWSPPHWVCFMWAMIC